MKYSIHIPLLVLCYFIVTAFYTFYQSDSVWMDVLWASYKNITLIACLLYMFNGKKIIWSDKLFIGACIINISVQTLMYVLCPFSTSEQKVHFFNLFGYFTVACALSSILYYLNELYIGTSERSDK